MSEWWTLQRFWPAGQAAGEVAPAAEGELAERRAERRRFLNAWQDSAQHEQMQDRQQDDPARGFPGPRVTEHDVRHAALLKQAELDGRIRIPCVREGELLGPAERVAWERSRMIANGDDRILRTIG